MQILRRQFQQLKNIYHFTNALVANLWHGFPSRRLTVIGVTGTDGKTTTTQLIYHILKTAKRKTAVISTVGAVIGGKPVALGFHVTTPDPWTLQKLISQAVACGEQYLVLEITSHGIDQRRDWGISYQIGVLTNVSDEHLDYHGNYISYLRTKMRLLRRAKLAVVNRDDRSYKYLKNYLNKNKTKTYSKQFALLKLFPNLVGFNIENYSAAYAVTKNLGIDDKTIIRAMQSFQLPRGRLDRVYNGDFQVIIDFAHTPNALEQLLSMIKNYFLAKGGRIVHVFGAAGLRDKIKRPLMGKVSSCYADEIILTEEDYRTEDPNDICRQIAEGINNKPFSIIIDRQQAINQAIAKANKGDLVVITGKGHENSLCRGTREYPWDEKEAVKKALLKRKLIMSD